MRNWRRPPRRKPGCGPHSSQSRKRQAFTGLRAAYFNTADAWSAIEFLHFGPVGIDFRFERMSYWPERKNATAKALTLLLAGQGDDGLAPEHFAGTSAAGQGLPALERLLFDDNAEALLLAEDADGDRRRHIGLAIARNVETMAMQILAGWRDGPDSVAKKLDDPAYAEEATARIATDLLGLFQLMRDTKIEAPLGKSIETAKPRLAEGWRSGRSIHAIAINLATLREAADIIFAKSSDEIASPSVLKSAVKIADSLSSENLSALVVSPKQRSDAILLYDAATSARDVCNWRSPMRLALPSDQQPRWRLTDAACSRRSSPRRLRRAGKRRRTRIRRRAALHLLPADADDTASVGC